MSKHDYERGRKAMAAGIIRQCWEELDPNNREIASLILERNLAVDILRQICEEHGDNGWPDNLNLADVIEKHLWRYLEEKKDA